jgi:glycine/D-amino acid oxidase-like deaminating enzyme
VAAAAAATAAAAAGGGAGPRVCILGAGVAGLTTAVRIAEEVPGARVEVLADRWGGDTTTHGAAGLWQPYKVRRERRSGRRHERSRPTQNGATAAPPPPRPPPAAGRLIAANWPRPLSRRVARSQLADTPEALSLRWGGDTMAHLLSLFASPDAAAAGVSLALGHTLLREPAAEEPFWAPLALGFRRLAGRELALLGSPSAGAFVDGWAYNVPICEGRSYLQYLAARAAATGRVTQTIAPRLATLADAPSGVDALVDCCGLGSRELCGDASLHAVRGQVHRVRAPWVSQAFFWDSFYIIPNPIQGSVVLGGTAQIGNESLAVSLGDRAAILEGAAALLPSLRGAEVLSSWVGLRPGRSSVRLELETRAVGPSGRATPLIHNVGHGGSGLTLAWGCAGDVVNLLRDVL